MTKMEMTVYQADKIGITKRSAKSTIDELNKLVTNQLRREGCLRMAGLGTFPERTLTSRVDRNAAAGEQIDISARTRLRFTPAKVLNDIVLGAR
jgi:DNA-binding protein HU-beta